MTEKIIYMKKMSFESIKEVCCFFCVINKNDNIFLCEYLLIKMSLIIFFLIKLNNISKVNEKNRSS